MITSNPQSFVNIASLLTQRNSHYILLDFNQILIDFICSIYSNPGPTAQDIPGTAENGQFLLQQTEDQYLVEDSGIGDTSSLLIPLSPSFDENSYMFSLDDSDTIGDLFDLTQSNQKEVDVLDTCLSPVNIDRM